jgi:hypothetical protein
MGFWPLGWRASLKRGTHCAWVGLAATNTLLAATCAPAACRSRSDPRRRPFHVWDASDVCVGSLVPLFPLGDLVLLLAESSVEPAGRRHQSFLRPARRNQTYEGGWRHQSCCTFQGACTRSSGNNDAQVQGQRKLHIAHSTTSCSSPWADHHIQEFFAYSTKSCSNELQHGFLCLSLYLH